MSPFSYKSRSALQIPYGLLGARIVSPNEVPRGLSGATCLVCSEELVSAQGEQVRPYFRHQSGVDRLCNYGGESIRHLLAKLALADRLRIAISEGADLPIIWRCNCVQKQHLGNLVRVATRISIDDEYVGPFLPDIGIFDDSRCRTFVEIEQTHANEPAKITYCRLNRIGLATVDISNPVLVPDPVAFVRLTPLKIKSDVRLYSSADTCRCGEEKLSGHDQCVGCLRDRLGIDIDISGSYRTHKPRLGTWAAIVTDADGTAATFSGEDTDPDSSQRRMLRRALRGLEQAWPGSYEVRIHSLDSPLNSRDGRRVFEGRAKPIRYWRSIRSNLGTGVPRLDRLGKLISDRKQLLRTSQLAKHSFQIKTSL